MTRFFIRLFFLLFASVSFAQDANVRLINNWEFYKGDLGSPWEDFRPVKQSRLPIWSTIDMPHCFNAFDPDVPYYEGPGWYRTFLDVDNPYNNGRAILHFEG